MKSFDFDLIANSCVKCGKCIPTCTIHEANKDEVTSPRGFLELLGNYQRGNLQLDKNAKDIFESCFLCTACVEICPNSLPVDSLIEKVRYDLAKKYGINWYKKAFFLLLKNRFLMDLFFKTGFVFQTCIFKKNNFHKANTPRFYLPIIKKNRLLPSLNKTSFLNSHESLINFQAKRKIGLFAGCLANYNYKNISESLLYILKKLNFGIDILKKQSCCGAPAYFTGDFDSVKFLAKKNIIYFEEKLKTLEAIIMPEATCSAMIKIDYEHIFSDDEKWRKRAKKVSEKIFLATYFLEKNTNLKQMLKTMPMQNETITYHDPCHAKKMQKVFIEPRELLKQNYKIKEMSNPNACCGFGGVTMQTQKYELSKKVGLNKAFMIKQSKADIVSAECSACKMQISNSLFINEVDVKFENPIELIARVLKKADNELLE